MSRESIKKKLLERDNYRCGIHLGGCGKQIQLRHTTKDHIIPRNIELNTGALLKYLREKKSLHNVNPDLFNLQPMCEICNSNKKKGVFPGATLDKKCPNDCCRYIYFLKGRKIPGLGYFPTQSHLFLMQHGLCGSCFILNDMTIGDKDTIFMQGVFFAVKVNNKVGFKAGKYGDLKGVEYAMESNRRYNSREIIEAATFSMRENKSWWKKEPKHL